MNQTKAVDLLVGLLAEDLKIRVEMRDTLRADFRRVAKNGGSPAQLAALSRALRMVLDGIRDDAVANLRRLAASTTRTKGATAPKERTK